MPNLSNVPFLGGYLQQEQISRKNEAGQLERAGEMQGLLAKLQAQKVAEQMRAVMASDAPMDQKIQALTRLPGGPQVAGQLAQLQEHEMKAKQAQREAAVFSPENIARNTTPGIPAQPNINPVDDNGTPMPGVAAVAPQVNLDALRQQAAMTGPKGMEVYSNHLAAEAQRKATLEAAKQSRLDNLQMRLYDIQTRSEDRALTREQQVNLAAQANQVRKDIAGIMASAMHREKNLQLTTDAAGNQLIVNPDGTTRPLTMQDGTGVKKAVAADKPMTEFQGKAALYGTRSAQSDKVLRALEDNISTTGLAAGQALGTVGNFMLSSEQQRVSQAQRDFVNAVLRQESGAVISDAEFANAKRQYFPQPGDNAATISQKRANRQLAIQGFARMSGPKGAQDIKAVLDEPLLPGRQATTPTPGQAGGIPPPPPGFTVVK